MWSEFNYVDEWNCQRIVETHTVKLYLLKILCRKHYPEKEIEHWKHSEDCLK